MSQHRKLGRIKPYHQWRAQKSLCDSIVCPAKPLSTLDLTWAGKQVQLPMYALANDNWIGRMPFALAPDGDLLGEMILKSLARGRISWPLVQPHQEYPSSAYGPRVSRNSAVSV